MPELPEVETIRLQLEKKIIGKKLFNRTITRIRRRGKVLMIDFKDGSSLVFHLKMTGQLLFNGQPSHTAREVFSFSDKTKLIFNDVRKFGWWKMVKDTKDIEAKFGPEALKISFLDFQKGLKRHPKAKIKSLLMNQQFIAGIGNIYADEILFVAKVAPFRQAGSLSNSEIKQIYRHISKILLAAIKLRGTSDRDYLDASGQPGNYASRLKVYRKTGKKCVRCSTPIKRLKLGGRSAHYCPKCQR